MLDWLSEQDHFQTIAFVLYVLFSVLFLRSHRISARIDKVASARVLSRLAQILSPQKKSKTEEASTMPSLTKKKTFAWWLRFTDWLFYDKLKLLPSARTGQQLNFFLLLLISWVVARLNSWVGTTNIYGRWTQLRDQKQEASLLLQQSEKLLVFSLQIIVLAFLLWLPFFFLLRKNREFYLDVGALFLLVDVSARKLAMCAHFGCCFGIPFSWGVYNKKLDTTVFPVQILEGCVGLACVVLCVLYLLFAKSYRPGRGCSLCLFFFLIPRFFWDFLRYRGDDYRSLEANTFFGLTSVQIVCVAGTLLGIIWLFLLPLEKKLMARLDDVLMRRLPKRLSLFLAEHDA
ncbi:MAG: prolipoprotein diacylglyceryl transferase [Oscillospiraceae bacterium]|jgi:hypothetical protein|nr:prolipoprotein diacylglyceryl transferase [Oscillospiraceae bacterium]